MTSHGSVQATLRLLACAAVVAMLPAGAPVTAQPPRDRVLRPPAERVAIRGRVIAADTGAPLARAQVRVLPRPGTSEGTAMTDAAGRYELLVRPGRYTVQASKPAYMSLSYGQRRAFEQGTFVEARAGGALDDVSFTLPRGAVVTGTVFEPFGEPAVGVGVRVLRYEYADGGWRLAGTGRGFPTTTDDRGIFRVFGLPPGSYYVEASPSTFFSRRGSAAREYAPTFYPGTTSIEAAQLVDVDIGEEVTIDFPLTTVLTATVSGHVVDEYGRPVTNVPSVSLIREGPSGARGSRSSGRLEADGRFVINAVAPGRYIAYATETGAPGRTRFATAEVTVSGERTDGVWLALTSGASARGRIYFDPQVTPDFTPDALQPFTMPRGSGLQLPVGRGIGHVNDDWSFEIRGMSGPQLVRLAGLPEGWTLRTVALAGRDITDTPIVFSRRMPTTGLQVLLTDRLTTVTGSARDTAGRPTTDYTVVIFPEEVALRVFPSRFVRSARPNQDGEFTLSGLPPSRYLAYAAQALPRGASTNLEFLAGLAPAAERFSLRDGEARNISLPLRPAP